MLKKFALWVCWLFHGIQCPNSLVDCNPAVSSWDAATQSTSEQFLNLSFDNVLAHHYFMKKPYENTSEGENYFSLISVQLTCEYQKGYIFCLPFLTICLFPAYYCKLFFKSLSNIFINLSLFCKLCSFFKIYFSSVFD